MPEPPRLPRRRLRLFLRDFRMVEGFAHMPQGITLAAYLANRRGYMHLLDLRWQPSGEAAPFAVVRVSQLMYVAAPDGDAPLVSATSVARVHPVELLVEGGLYVRGGVLLGPRQRLSDYLESTGGFVPITDAELMRSERPPRSRNVLWGDIAVNQEAIQAVWDGQPAENGAGDRAHVARAIVDDAL